MSIANEPVPARAKHAWREISRAGPPKRSAPDRIADYREIYALYDEETVRQQASRCIQCPNPLCRTGCPLANRIPEWLALAADGQFLEAAAVSQTTSNMPEICSRICPQERLCEGACILNARSDPVAIGAIEKFINEYAFAHAAIEAERVETNGLRVAVIGSGPGGLACADELVSRGYEVIVFEAQNRAGGLLVNGIPSFKLEKRIVDRRLEVLRRRGVKFRLGVSVGHDVTLSELRTGFDAIFLGLGAQQPKSLDVPGAEAKGVIQALPFLIAKNVSGTEPNPAMEVAGKRVAVLGGGDTAMDCLRTALRSGAREAICIYRRDLQNMPGSAKEYSNAVEEGAVFEFLTSPLSIESGADGSVKGVRCMRMELTEPDASGRRKTRPVAGSEFLVECEMVLVAYGFDPVPFRPGSGFEELHLNQWGALQVDTNQRTNLPGVFAGGDISRGPSLVVHAVRDGRKAAEAIDHYLLPARERLQSERLEIGRPGELVPAM